MDRGQSFVHATYLVGERIKSKAQLDQTRFEQFNFMYVMAGPPWNSEDFERPEDEVIRKLVQEYSYPTGNSGLALVPELIARAHQKEVMVLLSIPGSERFNPIAGDPKRRALFAKAMAAFVQKYDYDGIEIDWEHTYDRDQHTALMSDLRRALNALEQGAGTPSRRYYLTTALHSWRKFSREQAQLLSSSVDWVNIMTYDMGGGIWGHVPTHNTPLNAIKKSLEDNWSEFSPDKICIGLASYGFYYKGISPGQKSEVPLKEKGRYFLYTELPPLLERGWQESYDVEAEVPYYFSPDKTEFITIDNRRSLDRKTEWVFEQRFRGVFWWEFHCDYFPPVAEQQFATHPLMDHVTDEIGKNDMKSETMDPEEKALSELAISHLSKHLNIPKSQITLLSIKPTNWPDTSLGCPQPGMMYAQVITPGFRIELGADDEKYVYHTDRGSRVVLCKDAVGEGQAGRSADSF